MSRTLVALLTATVAMIAHVPAHADGTLLPVKDAAGVTYGYLEQSDCVIWAAPTKYAANTTMRHDKTVLVGDINSNYFDYEPVALPWANALRVGGRADWTLPSIEEAKAFYRSFYRSDTPSEVQARTGVGGTYWTAEVTTNQAAAVRPYSTGPIVQWYTRAGATAYVWPMRRPAVDEVLPVNCNARSEAINPFQSK